jgi:hypothetical protein
MKYALACFVKTPGLSEIKTRLAQDIGKKKAEEVYLKLIDKIKETLNYVSDSLDVFWAVGEDAGITKSIWSDHEAIYTGEGCLGERMSNIYSKLLAEGYDGVILIGSDIPEITPEHIYNAVHFVKEGNLVFGPCYDGGFYLFGGSKKIDNNIWASIKYSQDDTMSNLAEKISHISEIYTLEPLSDIDTIDDLQSFNV